MILRTRKAMQAYITQLEQEREVLYESRRWLSDELGIAQGEIRRYEQEERDRQTRLNSIFSLSPERGST